MSARSRRMFLANAAVGAAAATLLGLTSTGAAASAVGKPSYTSDSAGYMTGPGYQLRGIRTTFTVPPLNTYAGGASEGAEIMLSGTTAADPMAALTVQAGGGFGSTAWQATGWGTHQFDGSPAVGDTLTVSVSYYRNGCLGFRVDDVTQHMAWGVGGVLVGTQQYTRASVRSLLPPAAVAPPPASVRLWKFSGTHVTMYNGHQVSLLGPWVTHELIDTTTGTSTGAVVADAPALWNGGQSFSVWLQPTP